MTQPIEPTCETCRFWMQSERRCRRYPASGFVSSADWCGEHSPAALASPQPAQEQRITPEWCLKMAEIEGDQEIGAGLLSDGPIDCPHAQEPFRYCHTCPVTPCPIGLGKQSSQPAQEVDPIKNLTVRLVERIGGQEADNTSKNLRMGYRNDLVECLRTGIADLVKPVDGLEVVNALRISWGRGYAFDIIECLGSHGLRIIKEPGL